jgi:predicted ATP-grasp superfamily ATP-dependent carboligase
LKKVLITYGWVRSSYAALRNLSNHGVFVVVADSNKFGMCQSSNLPKAKYRYTSHYKDEVRFIDDIKTICTQEKIDFILPSHNETEIIAKYRKTLGESLCSLVPEYKHCSLFNNKEKAYSFAESIGIPVPKRYRYKCPDDLIEILKNDGPFVIKLLTGNSSKGVFYANNNKQAVTIVSDLIKKYQLKQSRYPQVEKTVSGQGWGCSVLYWQGKPIADFTHRRLREKISTGGTSTLREKAVHEGIRKATHSIFSEIGWHGLAMCEFKVCPETGKFWFIEVNPRLWGSISLSIESGVEFPYLSFLCASQGPSNAFSLVSEKVSTHKARWLLGDSVMVVRKISELKFADAISILTEKSNSTDDFHWDDPMAFVGQVSSYITNAAKGMSFNSAEKGMLK